MQKNLRNKPARSKMMKCTYIVLAATPISIIVGIALAFIFNPKTKVSKVDLNTQGTTYTLVDTIFPNVFNKVAVKLNLTGKRFFSSGDRSTSSKGSISTSYFRHLAYEFPINVRITRVRDGKVILEHSHVFELEPHDKKRVAQEEAVSREFETFVGNYPNIPNLESPETLRVDLTLGEDTTYGSKLKSGTLEFNQKGRSNGQAVGISMVVFSIPALGSAIFIILMKFLISSKQKASNQVSRD
jgi:hypothetical protein